MRLLIKRNSLDRGSEIGLCNVLQRYLQSGRVFVDHAEFSFIADIAAGNFTVRPDDACQALLEFSHGGAPGAHCHSDQPIVVSNFSSRFLWANGRAFNLMDQSRSSDPGAAARPDIHQIPGGLKPNIASLSGLGNG
jgi:hypothetical protein